MHGCCRCGKCTFTINTGLCFFKHFALTCTLYLHAWNMISFNRLHLSKFIIPYTKNQCYNIKATWWKEKCFWSLENIVLKKNCEPKYYLWQNKCIYIQMHIFVSEQKTVFEQRYHIYKGISTRRDISLREANTWKGFWNFKY